MKFLALLVSIVVVLPSAAQDSPQSELPPAKSAVSNFATPSDWPPANIDTKVPPVRSTAQCSLDQIQTGLANVSRN